MSSSVATDFGPNTILLSSMIYQRTLIINGKNKTMQLRFESKFVLREAVFLLLFFPLFLYIYFLPVNHLYFFYC